MTECCSKFQDRCTKTPRQTQSDSSCLRETCSKLWKETGCNFPSTCSITGKITSRIVRTGPLHTLSHAPRGLLRCAQDELLTSHTYLLNSQICTIHADGNLACAFINCTGWLQLLTPAGSCRGPCTQLPGKSWSSTREKNTWFLLHDPRPHTHLSALSTPTPLWFSLRRTAALRAGTSGSSSAGCSSATGSRLRSARPAPWWCRPAAVASCSTSCVSRRCSVSLRKRHVT